LLAWLAAGVACAGLAAVLAAWDPAAHPGPVLCLFRRLTGIPCPSCGLTRAAALIARGEFARSLAVHPALPLLGLEAAAAWGLAGERILTGRRRFERWTAPVLIATALALVALWLVRLATGTLPA